MIYWFCISQLQFFEIVRKSSKPAYLTAYLGLLPVVLVPCLSLFNVVMPPFETSKIFLIATNEGIIFSLSQSFASKTDKEFDSLGSLVPWRTTLWPRVLQIN